MATRALRSRRRAAGRWSTVGGAADLDADSFVCTNGRLHDAVIEALA
jgi:hypothetical protein